MINKKGKMLWYVLAVILVSAVLVISLSGLWQVIRGPGSKFVGDKDNLGLIVLECETACLTNFKSDYCERERGVYSPDESLAGKRTCGYLDSKLSYLNCEIKC